ncbi:MAG: hypothetical protein M1832_005367 [Thelocarpon impressellum]|nr:MAG: hypothetical protein M1832_005367 [Thelocarpon impressellum]
MADDQGHALDGFLSQLAVDTTRLHRLARRFCTTFRHLALTSTEQFLPTPITVLPSGDERGKFLAIDLGGTNLRVGFVELLGKAQPSPRNGASSADEPRLRRTLEKKWPIGEHLKMDQAEDLFDWIGGCIAEVVADGVRADLEAGVGDGIALQEIALGVTFSFPMKQHSLDEATLMPMGKGFTIPSNSNLRELLFVGYERRAAPLAGLASGARRLPALRIAAITNDTVATLASKAYTVRSWPGSRVAMGLIVGTGTNATIPMKVRSLEPSKLAQISIPRADHGGDVDVVVNTEWTINGSAPPLRELGFVTKWDVLLDRASEAPGFQPFEYMTAGRYLGELVRLIVLDALSNELHVPVDDLPELLRQRNALPTTFLTMVARAEDATTLAPHLSRDLPSPASSTWKWDGHTADVMRRAASLVHIRSAGLIAAAIVGLLGCTGELPLDPVNGASSPERGSDDDEELVVASTGGVITFYPLFRETCQTFIDNIMRQEGGRTARRRVVLREAMDGGIIGAGVLAGTASKK